MRETGGPNFGNGGDDPEDMETRAARLSRELVGDGPPDVWDETGGGDRRAKYLAGLRETLGQAVRTIEEEYRPVGRDPNVAQLNAALMTIFELASDPKPNVAAYLKAVLSKMKTDDQATKETAPANLYRGVMILKNSFSRVRPNPQTGTRDPDILHAFQDDYFSPIWQDERFSETLLQGVDSAYEVIKVFCGRELADRSGDELARTEQGQETLADVQEWLQGLQDEIIERAGIMRKSARTSSSHSVQSRYRNRIADMLKGVTPERPRPQ